MKLTESERNQILEDNEVINQQVQLRRTAGQAKFKPIKKKATREHLRRYRKLR